MHLQRVQVPDFRVLKDVDITFEHDFNPRVFPLGSQNGGGKSTLLQLIFILLYCSTNPERLPALKNLLSGFDLRDGEDKRILAIIDIWDGKKEVQLEFFVCCDTYIHQIFNYSNEIKAEDKLSFSTIVKLENIQHEISGFFNEEKELEEILRQAEYRIPATNTSRIFPNDLEKRLADLEIDFKSANVDFLDIDSLNLISKEAKSQLSEQHKHKKILSEFYCDRFEAISQHLRSFNIEYITVDSSKNEAFVCHLNNIDMDVSHQFLNELSNKVFLAAPSTQVFLFLPREGRKSLFTNRNTYQSSLTSVNSNLLGLFTYDFLATDILINSFKNARDKDFKEALKTGEYGNNYKKLLEDLDFLMHDKQVNLAEDFSGLTFKLNRFGDSMELYPEDLSHGELKRLSIYVWLKSQDIQDAIVLMDEVDLALHPDWQYRIPTDLVEWEPSNQYILATHSYELCESLTPSHVKILEPRLTERQSK